MAKENDFDKLLGELNGDLDTLAKAIPAEGEGAEDDEKIQAAAAEGEGEGGEGAGAGEGEGDGKDKEGEGEDAPLGKSMTVVIDGKEVEAVDGTELVKALTARVEHAETELVKALGTTVTLIKSQGDLIKSLQAEVKKLGGEGRGRKAAVTVLEKPAAGEPLKKAEGGDGIPMGEFMAKAMSAQAAGKITALEVSRIESYANRGLTIPADLVARVTQ